MTVFGKQVIAYLQPDPVLPFEDKYPLMVMVIIEFYL
jgi:hypothetical protein